MNTISILVRTPRMNAEDSINFDHLPPPTDSQKSRGWKRDYSSVMQAHSESLKRLFVDKTPNALDDFALQSEEKDSTSNSSIRVYDFTGGPIVRLAKQAARRDELEHDEANLQKWRREHTNSRRRGK